MNERARSSRSAQRVHGREQAGPGGGDQDRREDAHRQGEDHLDRGLLRQFFRTLPVDLEEAARIDGCTRLGVLFRIVLPLSLPALATLGIVTFLWTWNDFLWPLIVITSTDQSTVQLGLASFQGAHDTKWNLLMAGNVMALAPMLIVFVVAQRWFVRSLASTGIR